MDRQSVLADDAYLDALGTAYSYDLAEDDLSVLLLSWRRDVDSEPMPALVTTDEAIAVVGAAMARRGCA